jgi:hypothetical protein
VLTPLVLSLLRAFPLFFFFFFFCACLCQLDTTAPKMPDLSYTAQAIVQPTFQTAPVQNVQAITATAPTINKGYGSGLGLGQFGGYGAQGGLSARYGGF